MKAIIDSIGQVGSRVRLGGHEVTFDQPATVPGGLDRGASPLDLMVAAVGACAHYYAAAFLHGRNLSTEGLTVEVDSEKERVPSPRVGRVAIHVHLPAGLSERHVAGIERAVKSCPAYGTLMNPPVVTLSVAADAPAVPAGTDEKLSA